MNSACMSFIVHRAPKIARLTPEIRILYSCIGGLCYGIKAENGRFVRVSISIGVGLKPLRLGTCLGNSKFVRVVHRLACRSCCEVYEDRPGVGVI